MAFEYSGLARLATASSEVGEEQWLIHVRGLRVQKRALFALTMVVGLWIGVLVLRDDTWAAWCNSAHLSALWVIGYVLLATGRRRLELHRDYLEYWPAWWERIAPKVRHLRLARAELVDLRPDEEDPRRLLFEAQGKHYALVPGDWVPWSRLPEHRRLSRLPLRRISAPQEDACAKVYPLLAWLEPAHWQEAPNYSVGASRKLDQLAKMRLEAAQMKRRARVFVVLFAVLIFAFVLGIATSKNEWIAPGFDWARLVAFSALLVGAVWLLLRFRPCKSAIYALGEADESESGTYELATALIWSAYASDWLAAMLLGLLVQALPAGDAERGVLTKISATRWHLQTSQRDTDVLQNRLGFGHGERAGAVIDAEVRGGSLGYLMIRRK